MISVPPRDLSLTEGRSSSIKCGYTGDAPLTVDWLYEEETLPSSDRITLEEGTLRFATTLSSDTGRYTCRIANEVGVVMATAQLTVLGGCSSLDYLSPVVSRMKHVRCSQK